VPASHGQAWSGVIDSSRAVDWSKAGVVDVIAPGTVGIPNRTQVCSTLTSSATAAQINSAISTCPSGQVVSLGAGTYNLNNCIDFTGTSNITLRGAGPNLTIIKPTSGCACNSALWVDVCISGSFNWTDGPQHTTTWTAGYAQGTTVITLGSVAGLSNGQYHPGPRQ
jgi:hypothetical protein